jgi:hypothetical protein
MFKWLFGKKEETEEFDDEASDTEKWIGRIKGAYTRSDDDGEEIARYPIMWDLYVDEFTEERIVRGYGKGFSIQDTPFTHQFYKTILLSWEEGAPDELLAPHLNDWDTDYWKDKKLKKPEPEPEYEWKEV